MFKKQFALSATLGSALLLMGINIPSCPGQQAMQKQLDDSATKQAELTKNISTQADKIKGLEKEVSDLKTSLGEVAEVLKSHKATIEGVQTKVDDMAARASAPKKSTPPRRR